MLPGGYQGLTGSRSWLLLLLLAVISGACIELMDTKTGDGVGTEAGVRLGAGFEGGA